MMTELQKHINGYFQLTSEEYQQIESYFKRRTIKKGDYFLREEQFCREVGFIQSGILIESLNIGEKEITRWIFTAGHFVVDLPSFLFNQKTTVNYQAIEDTKLYVMGKHAFDKIGERIPRWRELEKLSLSGCSSALKSRLTTHLSMNAEERYNYFFQQNPGLFNKVPLIHIASVLGMSPETLSRIRKKQSQPTS